MYVVRYSNVKFQGNTFLENSMDKFVIDAISRLNSEK